MALELKSGPMLFHKRRCFGSNWRKVHSILYNDSTFLWYKDKSRKNQAGSLVLKNAPELIAFGAFTAHVPNRPKLPKKYEAKELLAFGVRSKDVVYWFLCPNQEEVRSWMAAIASSMPSPQASVLQQRTGNTPPPQKDVRNAPKQEMENDSPYDIDVDQVYEPQYQPEQSPPHHMPNQQMPACNQEPPGIQGHYPPSVHCRQPTYQDNFHSHAHQYPACIGGPTTVIVQKDCTSATSGGAGNFAMGMLLGGATGTAWGSHMHSGLGCGSGWGSSGKSVNDHTDITINNYYENDTTTVNNVDVSRNTAIEPVDVGGCDSSYGGGGFGGGDFGGGGYGGSDFGGGGGDYGGGSCDYGGGSCDYGGGGCDYGGGGCDFGGGDY